LQVSEYLRYSHYELLWVAKEYNVPLIGDGGIKYSGDITKALAAGVMYV
jgi:isopentenyl diphosphate isomerase/L-lactate dehydrogenase-like FMN-dependent dehydrogenase